MKITSNTFFMKLYKELNNIIKKTKIDVKNILIKNIDIKDIITYLDDNDFTSKNMQKHIFNTLKHGYEITYLNNTIIYFTSKKLNGIPKLIKHMMFIIVVLKKLFKREYSQKLIYFETNKKKEFPEKNNIKITTLAPDNVNTAVTFIDLHKNGNIILYRKEEAIKVLIHELIHSNLIDEKLIFTNKNSEFTKLFCTNYKILLNEAFTETMACIINIFIIHIINNFKTSELDKMFLNEFTYSNYICSKIKTYYKIDKISNIIKKNGEDKECIDYFPQQTNVFSYYFLKNILLKNHILLGKLLKKHSIYYKIVDDICVNNIMKLLINNISDLDNRLIKISDKNKSLKMSLY